MLVGGLVIGLFIAGLTLRKRDEAVSSITFVGSVLMLIWFFNAQIGRYLISVAPLLCVPAGVAAYSLIALGGSLKLVRRITVCSLIVLGAIYPLEEATIAPTSYKEAQASGRIPTAVNFMSAFAAMRQPTSIDERLDRSLSIYPAMKWINENTSSTEGVALFEETRGYYLKRDTLWANGLHSSFIPYESFKSDADLRAWFTKRGFNYALFNLTLAPNAFKDPDFANGPSGVEEAAFRKWYSVPLSTEEWRHKMSLVVRDGHWHTVCASHGVIVIQWEKP